MAAPKKNAKDFSQDSKNENLNAKAKSSRYDDDDDDFDSLQMDELDAYENDYDEEDD